MTLAVLIPAAGESSRLGQAKQLVNLHGQPMLQDRIRLCSSAIENINGRIFCVLGANAHQIRHRVIDHRCRFLFYPQWQKGLASTISFGVSQLPKQISAVMILLADQWAVDKQDLTTLIEAYKGQTDKIFASSYEGIQGVPAIFPKRVFNELIALAQNDGVDEGARHLLQQYCDEVVKVPMEHAKLDLDTQEQLQQMLAHKGADT